MSDKICLFDLDGTLADYDGAMRTALKKINDTSFVMPADLHHTSEYLENQMDMIKNQPGFWADLEPIGAGFQLLSLAQQIGFTCMILSKGPTKCTSAWTEKLLWCSNHCPDVGVTITSAPKGQKHKGLVYGRVLVDDYPDYVEQWLNYRPRGSVIMPSYWGTLPPTNADYNHKQVLKYRGGPEDYAAAAKVLQQAFDR